MQAYRQWLLAPVVIDDITVRVASKPGVTAHGSRDVAAFMLAEAAAHLPLPTALSIGQDAKTMPRANVWQCGNGLVAAVLQSRGWAVTACDRIITNAQAARRTLGDVDNATNAELRVHHAPLFGADATDASLQLAVIRLPTDRISTQLMLDEAFRTLAVGGVCLLAGANDEGAKTAARTMAACFGNAEVEAQHSGHRLLKAIKRTVTPADGWSAAPWADFDHWHIADGPSVRGVDRPLQIFARPGVFSWEHLDEATAILASCLDVTTGESVLDLGCGAGVLGVLSALANGGGRVLMLDADSDAVRSAQRTAEAAGVAMGPRHAEVRASDVASAAGDERFDVVVSNPPFHLGKATDLLVPAAFIDESHERLNSGGRLLLVANRTLPYERLIAERFGAVRTVHDGRRFKVLGATRA
ncbi:MAG: class I SAM-dependent methyltransferase [Gemmatimonadaceae bacterium]|nr:class I SAM-dependent methyltransferase [Gemmatimonadaceae bacterium]